MGKSTLELAVGTGQWNAGLKKATSALDNFTKSQGGLQQALAKDSENMRKFVQMMGKSESTAKTAKGQMNDYKTTIEQLTMQYNRMTDAQKQSIGKDYLQSIDRLKQKYQAVNEEIQEMNRSLNGIKQIDLPDMKDGGLFGGGKFDGMLQVFGGNLMTKGAGMVAGLAADIGDALKQGIELARQGEGIRVAFERLGRGDILDGLREATHGTVTDLELMKAAVKFNDFKLPVEELGTMLAFAQQKAKDTGQSVDYMVDSIVTGLGRKSLMILDNLGLSANEVKEKMKDTGDMTKAVGEIIREQMSKSGDYVETAADRAQQANVQMQNKMEELGRKFGPLQEASSNFWTSMKLGILDVVGGPLTTLLNGLTEAGRMMNAYGKMGGDGKVGRMIANLAGASEGKRQFLYSQQQENFWRYINPREQHIKDIRAWQSGERSESLQGRINVIRDKYGSLDATKIQAEVDAAKKQLSDYIQAAKEILNPSSLPTVTTTSPTTTTKKTKVKTPKAPKEPSASIPVWEIGPSGFNEQTISAWTSMVKAELAKADIGSDIYQSLTDNLSDMSRLTTSVQDAIRLGLTIPQADVERMFETVFDQGNLPEDMYQGMIQKFIEDFKEKTGKDLAVGANGGLTASKGKDERDTNKLLKLNEKSGEYEMRANEILSTMAGGIGNITSGLESLGMEIPAELKSVINGMQSISTILTGIATTVLAIEAIAGADAIIPFAGGGIVGRAAGGLLVGNHLSGDNLRMPVTSGGYIGINDGELILNKAQQFSVASQLEGNGLDGLSLDAFIRGEDIRLVLNRNGRRTGRGEYITTRNSRI